MNFRKLFFAVALSLGLVACSSDDDVDSTNPASETGNTYVSVSLNLTSNKQQKALPEDYNPAGTYEGFNLIRTLDLYMTSSDGTVQAKRFAANDLSIDGALVTLNQPFRTTSGNKTIHVVLNSPSALGTSAPAIGDLWDVAGLASVQNEDGVNWDVITMTGRTASPVNILPDITQQAATEGANKVSVNVVRLASRAIVTTTASTELTDQAGARIGTISNVTYSVAQGTNKVYAYGNIIIDSGSNTTVFQTWGTEYVPTTSDYATEASKYYVYSDLSTPSPVPTKPAGDDYVSLPGKFLYENTHKEGTVTTSDYKKGNTAYILVKATLTPDAAAVADGGTLVNNTFYVGQADGKIYSTKEAAQTAVFNQRVALYQGGKVLYYAWLNPDNVATPLNSPVIRNNIYHVNITGFGKIGLNWNPLYPEDPDTPTPNNPDPKPQNPDEPDTPIVPTDPLTPEETYMSVDVSVIEWNVHSYDIEL